MQRIEQADDDEGEQQCRCRHAGTVGADPPPGRQQGRISGNRHTAGNPGCHQQPDDHVRPENDNLEAAHSKRIRGSTSV